jgi:hypothetical protein
MTAMCQRGLDIRLKLQINHITRLELTFRTMFVSLLLHPLFGTIQVLTNNVSHQLTIRQPGLQISDRLIIRQCNTKMPRGVAIQYLKRGAPQC